MADQSGIELLLELTAKLDGATKMVRALGKVESEALRADQALRKAEQKTTRLDRAMRHAGNGFRVAGGALRDFGTTLAAIGVGRLLEGAIRTSVGLGKSMLMAAAGAEKTERAYSVMFGAGKAKPLLEALDQLAGKTELTDDMLKSAGQELGAAGFKPAEVIKSVAAALDVAARTGKGGQAFEGAIAAMKQMQVLGKVPRGLGEMGFGKGAGKQIQAEMKSGTSAVEAFARVLEKSTGKPIGSFALERGKDLDVTLSKIADLPDQFGQKLSRSPGYEQLKLAAAGFLEAFDPDSPRGQRIFKGLERMMERVAEVVKKIDVDKLAKTVVNLFEQLPPLIEKTAKAVGWLMALISKEEKPQVEDRNQPGLLPGIQKWTTPERAMRPTPEGMLANYKDRDEAKGSWLGRQQQKVSNWWDKTFPPSADELAERARVRKSDEEMRAYYEQKASGKALDRGLVAGLREGAPEVEQASSEVAKIPAAVTRAENKVQSPSLVFADIGAQLAAGMVMGIERGMPDVMDALDGFTPMAGAVGGGGLLAPAPSTPGLQAHVVVHINGVGGESAREIGEEAERGVLRGLEEILSRLAAQGA